ncbi:FAD-binding oxidoreductase [Granulosicoccaceae sp. 1_MG-2023]|nr:FAD-binding oxidoreductase [Granulosicoccaceae sp. 1_MG-2023]
MTLTSGSADALKTLFGKDFVDGRSADAAGYGADSNRYYKAQPGAVVFPRTVQQVQELVKLANRQNLALVPSGGRTGLSGAASATAGEVVVAFDRMTRIGEVNMTDRLVECEAGVVTQQLHEAAARAGLHYPVDFASSGSSRIGGNIATNAGGIKVTRYGLTRDWVAGLEVVTGRGDVLQLNRGLIKNATGYDLRQLFIGSEGTLGFITSALMRLTVPPKNLQVMLLAFKDIDALMAASAQFRRELPVTAFEFFCQNGLQKVLEKSAREAPFDTAYPFYGLLEFEAPYESVLEDAMDLFESLSDSGQVADAVLAQSGRQAADLWFLRESLSETLSHFMPYKNDLSVQLADVPAFMARIDACVAQHYPDFCVVWFGHIGDGNLHLNILKPADLAAAEFKARCERVNADIFACVQAFGGSISAEHGVGLQKKNFLGYSRSAEEIAMMRAVKAAFDPNGIMNPGKVLPD